MTGEQAINQNVSFYPTDIAIIEAVQERNGSGFSGAIRFIIREWARTSGFKVEPDEPTAPRVVKSRAVKRIRARRLSEIPGVERGIKLN